MEITKPDRPQKQKQIIDISANAAPTPNATQMTPEGVNRGQEKVSQATPQTQGGPAHNRNQKPNRGRRVPPITVFETRGYTTLIGQIQGKLTGALSTTYKGDSIVYQATNPEDFQYLKQEFRKRNLEFFTYNDDPKSTLKVVVKRLTPYWTPEDVKNALIEKGFPVQGVFQMSKPQTETDDSGNIVSAPRRKTPNFQVNLLNTAEARKIFKVERLLHMKVTVELYQKPSGPTQCYLCQRFRHGATQCELAPRCVKCAGPHLSGACTKKREEPAICANCRGNHPASFRGCPVRLKIVQAWDRQRASAPGRQEPLPRAPPRNSNPPPAPPTEEINPPPSPTPTRAETRSPPNPAQPQQSTQIPTPQHQPLQEESPTGNRTLAEVVKTGRTPPPPNTPKSKNQRLPPKATLPIKRTPPQVVSPPQTTPLPTPTQPETERAAKTPLPSTSKATNVQTPRVIPAQVIPAELGQATAAPADTNNTTNIVSGQTTAQESSVQVEQEQPLQFLSKIWALIKSLISPAILEGITQLCTKIATAPDIITTITILATNILPLLSNGK
ncbi:proteoglycan 4-like [Schistocerca nitens]|uniref:proteoglycan 4-like n=1 Tax=Schistocerca nitens TaxID=7011 RepID=UPI00211832C5|nr:proteoglycan 4-like [Schistocerca nitens]